MIPKIIHYVWVGENPKSEIILKCIDSWKKYCPDYKIIEWNNTSLENINNLYIQQAFECKKWAFVSDYLRLYALKNFGGFYFDTDLEITQSLDEFLDKKFISGYEKYNNKVFPITALMGCEINNTIISDLLDKYQDIPFITNGQMDMTTNTSRISKYFEKKFNLNKPYNANEKTILDKDCIIYPSYYFCTKEENKTNYSIHHYNGSWKDGYTRKNIFSFKNFKIVKFHKDKNSSKDNLPLLQNEQIKYIMNIKTYKFAILKSKNN